MVRQNPIKARRLLLASLTVLVFLVGCYKMVIHENKTNMMKLEKGMPKEAVLKVMGKPNYQEVYETLYGNQMMVLFYYSQRKQFDGMIAKDECTPVVIKNQKLVGWGDYFYDRIQRREKKIEHQ
jgi:outer membrane protein assembly factor BamE (lipoprotein component of BamABCDE complex)